MRKPSSAARYFVDKMLTALSSFKLLSVVSQKYSMQVFELFWLSRGDRFFIRWFFALQGYLLIFLLCCQSSPLRFPCMVFFVPSGATHVPTFYSPVSDSEVVSSFALSFRFLVLYIYCLGWILAFSTETEKKISSLTITIIPVLY